MEPGIYMDKREQQKTLFEDLGYLSVKNRQFPPASDF